MKVAGIGDMFIPSNYIKEGFEGFVDLGFETDFFDWKLEGFDQLQAINLQIEQSGSNVYDVPQYIIDKVEDCDIIVTQFCPINKKVIDACEKLKIIGILRGGCENVDVDYAVSKNISVYNTPGRNSDSVADFTIGAMICECRNIARGHLGLKSGKWIRTYPNSEYIPDLPGKTIGVIGLGEIGKKVVKRLSGFDVNILSYDPYLINPVDNVVMTDLDTLMKKSDFITVHARLTEETKNLINEKNISLMKKTAYLINTSRAGLIDEKALYTALKSNIIAGAMLDVFETEPPGSEYPLVTLDNVTLTPHMAGGSKDAFYNSPKKLAEKILNII